MNRPADVVVKDINASGAESHDFDSQPNQIRKSVAVDSPPLLWLIEAVLRRR